MLGKKNKLTIDLASPFEKKKTQGPWSLTMNKKTLDLSLAHALGVVFKVPLWKIIRHGSLSSNIFCLYNCIRVNKKKFWAKFHGNGQKQYFSKDERRRGGGYLKEGDNATGMMFTL